MDTVPMTFDRAPETRWNNRESVFVQFDVARSRPHPGSNPALLKTTTKLKQSSAIGPACTEPFHSRQRFSQAGLAEAHAYHHTAPRLALRIESANATSLDPRSSFMKAGDVFGSFSRQNPFPDSAKTRSHFTPRLRLPMDSKRINSL